MNIAIQRQLNYSWAELVSNGVTNRRTKSLLEKICVCEKNEKLSFSLKTFALNLIDERVFSYFIIVYSNYLLTSLASSNNLH